MKFLLILILPLMTCTKQTGDMNFSYADGSNNTYTLENKSLSYDPIKPHESSSGEYDGGTAKTKELTEKDITGLKVLVDRAINCNNCHTDKRMMMTGLLKINENKYILLNRSAEKEALEKLLGELLKD